jgi:hypothetical protein
VALTAAPVDIDGATVVTATLSVEISGKIAWIPTDANVVSLANGDLAVDVPVGGTVVIYNEDTTSPPFQVEALVGNITEYNYWGMH